MLENNQYEYINKDAFLTKNIEQQAALWIQAQNRIEDLENKITEIQSEKSKHELMYEKYFDLYFQGKNHNKRLTIAFAEVIQYIFELPRPKSKCDRKRFLKWLKRIKKQYLEYKLVPGIYNFKELL